MVKCNVCGIVLNEKPDVCPKCGAKDFTELTPEAAALYIKSRETDILYIKAIKAAAKLQELSAKGIELNLDPACVSAFTKIKAAAYLTEQMSKAELISHSTKGKF